MLALFPDEQIITQSSDASVTLTTHRICNEQREWGNSYNQSIMLEHITSCENRATSNVTLFILAAMSVIIGAITINHGGILGIILGVILILLYHRTKKSLIVISSPSTKITLNVDQMRRDKVLEFINKVEHAKHRRLVSLNTRTYN